MRHISLLMIATVLGTLLLATHSTVDANGGQVRIANQPVGPYEVTVFTSPVPLRTGTIDVSVLLQRADTKEIVDGAELVLSVAPVGGGTSLRYPVTRDQATNKLYYAAEFSIDQPGEYLFQLEIQAPEGAGSVTFTATVERAGTGFWRSWWFWGLVGVAAVIFLWRLFAAPVPERAEPPTGATGRTRRR
ncbi:hypothetical protein OO015_08970 [Thermomicrobium sp. 4228-Ro]|uniref:hypothetical protein n=1 Tax=Thermomicrobium sp. 4228-Ro TaxID=2993937 RepID=UPI00224876B3|nr:hypothetical protein [Thermomicrobium sp. 4228-Ro]MCX2727625.1 hypothetical protein [Thermomicrobium sp. 4228-Ro]